MMRMCAITVCHGPKFIQVDPLHADAYYFIGAIYNICHNSAQAIVNLKQAHDADAQEADTHFRLAKALRNVGMMKSLQLLEDETGN